MQTVKLKMKFKRKSYLSQVCYQTCVSSLFVSSHLLRQSKNVTFDVKAHLFHSAHVISHTAPSFNYCVTIQS